MSFWLHLVHRFAYIGRIRGMAMIYKLEEFGGCELDNMNKRQIDDVLRTP